MSRSQETQAFNTGSAENQTTFGNAENAYHLAQTDVGNYEGQLAKFAAGNPFVAGGEYQTSQNRVLANTADAGATAAGARLQQTAARTGQNPAGAQATSEVIAQNAQRQLGGQQAAANAERIGQEAGYNKSVLGASAVPAELEAKLSGQQGQLSDAELAEMQKAGETPSGLDIFGGSFLSAAGKAIGSGAGFAG